MKKEEFPTFLNEQPTVIFGRTVRELLIIVCGIIAGYTFWGSATPLFAATAWTIFCALCSLIIVLLSIVIALLSIGNRPLEEWLLSWLTYTLIPKVYLYKPALMAAREEAGGKRHTRSQERQALSVQHDVADDFDES